MLGGQWRSLAWWSMGGSHAWWPMKDPMFGGQWRSLAWWSMKIPCLVVNEESHAWWSMKIPCLVVNGRIPCLVVNGRIPCLVVNEDPLLGGQWRIPCLVVNGRIPCLVVNEDPLLGGQWRIPCLVVNGRRRRRFLATYSHFPLSDFIWTFILFYFLSFDLKFLLNHGPRPSFTPPFPFLGL
jgi:hypothetical protein